MIKLAVLSLIFVAQAAFSQIADSSFFPSVRSINPGVAHNRVQAMTSLNVSQKKVEKKHDVTAGGIQDGINTDVDLQKNTAFYASKGGHMAFEFLLDHETGKKVEKINSTTYGARNVANKSASSYYGAIIDFKYFGISYAGAKYETDYKFRVGSPPNVSAKDIKTNIDYTLLKIGSALNFNGFTVGAFAVDKKSVEKYEYTYYDPSSGAQGTTETWPAKGSSSGYGVGLGYTTKTFRFEVSTEHMGKVNLDYEENPMEIFSASPATARFSAATEIRFGKISAGFRFRHYGGNFTDLEDLISSNLLYGEMSDGDTRIENSFNFGYGSDKGISFSAFYTQSETKTDEKSLIFGGTDTYPAKTKASAYGASVSYYFK